MASRSEAHFHPPSSVQAKRLKVINNGWPGIESVETHWHHRVGLPELVGQGVAHCLRRLERMPAGRVAPQPLQRWCHYVLFRLGTRRQGGTGIRRCGRVGKAQEMPAGIGSTAGGCGRTRLAESLLTGATASVRCALTFSDRRGFMVVDSAERVSSIKSRESPRSASFQALHWWWSRSHKLRRAA